jgi:DNA-binding transcriptional MerR regulator
MNGAAPYSIGDLARRTGLPVRTIRFYSDSGVLPPTDRSPAGYRRYDLDALARLELIRTLRELGLDLAAIRRILDREIAMAEVARAHVEALDVQIRTLRLRQSVLRAVAKRGSSPEEVQLMHKLVRLSDEERNRIIHDFVDDAFGDVDANPELVALLRAMTPDLPDDPSPAQVDAWVELADLVSDATFKASVRRAAEHQAAERADGDRSGLHHDLTNQVCDRVRRALADGIDPASPASGPVVAELVGLYAETFGAADSGAYRDKLLLRLRIGSDPRVERYWQLISVINGWPAPPVLAPIFDWFIAALEYHRLP